MTTESRPPVWAIEKAEALFPAHPHFRGGVAAALAEERRIGRGLQQLLGGLNGPDYAQETLAKLAAAPGDLVIATVASDHTAAAREALRDALRKCLPGVAVLVLTDDVTLAVLPPAPAMLLITHSPGVMPEERKQVQARLVSLGYGSVAVVEGIAVEPATE